MFIRIIGWVIIILGAMFILGSILGNKEGSGERTKPKEFVIAGLIILLIGMPMAFHHSKPKNSVPHHITKAEKASSSAKKVSSSKASSKREESKKEKSKVKKAREKNERENLANYKTALKTVPTKTKGTITSAYVDKDSGETMVTLSDDALALSSNELKTVVKSAWNAVGNLRSNYTPFSSDKGSTEMYITIQDSAGNKLAHTSLLGSFKYDGE